MIGVKSRRLIFDSIISFPKPVNAGSSAYLISCRTSRISFSTLARETDSIPEISVGDQHGILPQPISRQPASETLHSLSITSADLQLEGSRFSILLTTVCGCCPGLAFQNQFVIIYRSIVMPIMKLMFHLVLQQERVRDYAKTQKAIWIGPNSKMTYISGQSSRAYSRF